MSPRELGFIGLGGGLIGGFLLGVSATIEWAELRANKKYEESSASMRRAYEAARINHRVDEPVIAEDELEVALPSGRMVAVTGDISNVNVTPLDREPTKNRYHQAIEAVATPIETFVEGAINDYGISYIEEEEFHDEGDGRFKGQITWVIDDTNPTFFMDGHQISDWDERVGHSILIDFDKHVPQNISPQVLYVRNHQTGEDYEVIREIP